MATDTVEAPSAASADAAAGSNSGMMKIAVIVLVAMALEGAAMFYIFGGSKPAAAPEQGESAQSGALTDNFELEGSVDEAEVEIGLFNTTNTRAARGSVFHISFKLFGIVAQEDKDTFNEAANKVHEARVRQAVIRVIRSSSMDDLDDPNLGTTRRLIREEINKILRKSYLIDVVINDVRIMEQ